MVFGGGTLRLNEVTRMGVSMVGLVPLVKEEKGPDLNLCHVNDTVRRAVSSKPGRRPSPGIRSAGHLILDCSARSVRNKHLLFKLPSLRHCVIAA